MEDQLSSILVIISLIFTFQEFFTITQTQTQYNKSIHSSLMESRLKRKTTINVFDMEGVKLVRAQRKNKTRLKSYIENKDGYHNDSSLIVQKEKEAKTLVEFKIEQLHRKMKNFFTHQRINHLQQIAPQLQQLKSTICQLRQELQRPKSIEQVQFQKHQFLIRKNSLLKQINEINKQLKQNKSNYFRMRLQSQQLDRQLNNSHATIQKYKQKLSHLQQSSSKLHETISVDNSKGLNDVCSQLSSCYNGQRKCDQDKQQNLQRILNDSLCDQRPVLTHVVVENSPKKSQQIPQHQSDHVHITQVSNLITHQSKHKLPFIPHHQKNKNSNYSSTNSHPEKLNSKLNSKLQSIRNTQQNPQLYNKKEQKKSVQINFTQLNHLTQAVRNISNTSLIENIHQYPINRSLNTSQFGLQKHHNDKLLKSKRYPLDWTVEIRKYQQLKNKKKWNQVESLFIELNNIPVKEQTNSQTQQNHMNQDKNSIHLTNLQELLMEELRKQQFSNYKQKGYHEGLKDKTHQIKIQIKNIFNNFSGDQFFSEVINKKTVKKQLNLILENCMQ